MMRRVVLSGVGFRIGNCARVFVGVEWKIRNEAFVFLFFLSFPFPFNSFSFPYFETHFEANSRDLFIATYVGALFR